MRTHRWGMLGASLLAASVGCGDDGSATGAGGGGGTGGGSTSSASSSSSAGPTSTSSGQGGDPAAGGGGAGSTGGGDATGGGGSGQGGDGCGGDILRFPDDCTGLADCPGGECVEVGGFGLCQYPVDEQIECTSEVDLCCNTEDCGDGGGLCVQYPDASYCGGAAPIEQNVCSGSGCVDCPKGGGTCLPGGVLGYAVGQCIPQFCEGDSDCTDDPCGGRCVPLQNPCCGAVVGMFCAYDDGCRSTGDCDEGSHCVGTESGRTECVAGIPECPA